ncbi:hypothetical protein SAMN05660493_01548 [Epilithonimonas bovis DSM 19482]|uniref:Uncharacterized protein n=1 Tax=Epilithonimonas bovis DSM 19482 TaxID=1121284 RepID=A0A1U7PXZ8_9FLAO|nr:hypothetical protein [Epilithonimonas bovis]SIT96853.1 hypothetical protein SAMN05660493_01548 [Epilithonimonas bovis DSM 19482]
MKKTHLFIAFSFWGCINVFSQDVAINEKLLAQITKNQTVRLASNQAFLDSYTKQNELYNDINKKLVQVVAIQNHIYTNLSNVNSAIKQSKRLVVIGELLIKVGKNSAEMLSLTAQYPQYSVLLYEIYAKILDQSLALKNQITQEVLNEDNDFLMDQYDREKILQNIYTKASIVNSDILYIILKIKNRKVIPYLYQVPVLRDYINLDKHIINTIIRQYQWSF